MSRHDTTEEYDIKELSSALNTLFMVFCMTQVFWMQAGFALLESGSIRSKNSMNILFKNLMDICITTEIWWWIGYAMSFGEGDFIGDGKYGSVSKGFEVKEYRDWLWHWAFAGSASTIVSGCMAERTTVHGYMIMTVAMNLLIYPFMVKWVWGGGWLAQKGFVDFAGSGVVHVTGGFAGLAGAIVVGRRHGRFDKDVDQATFRPHNMPQVVLGTFILWMGWYCFNGGSLTAIGGVNEIKVYRVFMNTTLACVSSGTGCFLFRLAATAFSAVCSKVWHRGPDLDLGLLCNSLLAGLVSVTASCDVINDWNAFVIGLVGGLVYLGSNAVLERLKIDDPLYAFSVHGACGMWGIIAVGLFDKERGLFYGGGWKFLGWQALGVLIIASWSSFFMLLTTLILSRCGKLRVNQDDQLLGADRMKHGGLAYGIAGLHVSFEVDGRTTTNKRREIELQPPDGF